MSVNVPHYENSRFYDANGCFLQDVAKAAYFEMMTAHGYFIPDIVRNEMWVTDFNLGDFAHAGMGGIFWCNEMEDGYFAHEIYLLPGQMIVEHSHHQTAVSKPKKESWHVRNGSIFTYGEEGVEPPEGYPIAESQKNFVTVHLGGLAKAGDVNKLNRATAPHCMVAGAEGAIVSEYGTPHDGDGLRFTNPSVKF